MKSNSLLYALNDVGPDVILSAEPGKKKTENRSFKIAASALIITGIFVFVGFALNNELSNISAAHVYLDVNPSFVIDVSKSGKILAVSAGNDDAEKVLSEDFEQSANAGETVMRLLNMIMEDGYLSEEKDTLLLSVESEDYAFAEKLKAGFADDAYRFFSEKLPDGHIITQSLSENKQADNIAESYGISKGVAAFLIRLIGIKDEYNEKTLAALDLSELRRLCEDNGISASNKVTQSPAAADEAARRTMTDELLDDPVSSESYYVDKKDSGFWRVIVRGVKNIAVYDVDDETGVISRGKNATVLDSLQLLDAAISGAGFSIGDIAHYEILKSEEWNCRYVTFPSFDDSETAAFLSEDIDLSTAAFCDVKLHTADGLFLTVRMNSITGNTVWVRKDNYTYSIDMLDAVIIGMSDAGLTFEIPVVPDKCVIERGVCYIEFEYGTERYAYRLDAFSADILSKQVTQKEA